MARGMTKEALMKIGDAVLLLNLGQPTNETGIVIDMHDQFAGGHPAVQVRLDSDGRLPWIRCTDLEVIPNA
jgi:hypothetical protein